MRKISKTTTRSRYCRRSAEGKATFAVVREPIDPRAVEATVRADAFGGVVTFVGIVRERDRQGRAVEGLWYEAYEAMARDAFVAVAHEARQFGDVRLAIVHRVGELRVGEVAVCVVAAAAHRDAAFAACRYAIDQVKQRAPIWKKERYADGQSVWRENACERAR